MTKKPKMKPVEELLARPWCYYCERDFDDLKVLLQHQKAKHFRCDRCGRRLNTAGGLSVHMTQVHKENLETVENALPSRSGLNIEIFGMEGIPDDILQQHNQRIITEYHQAAADRQAATGNPPPGGVNGAPPAKKVKVEDPSELKARLAAFKAKKAGKDAEALRNANIDNTSAGATQVDQSTASAQSPALPQTDPSPYQPTPPHSILYGQQSYGEHTQQAPFGQSQSPFPQPGYPPPGTQYPPPAMQQYQSYAQTGAHSFPQVGGIPYHPAGSPPFARLGVLPHPQAGSASFGGSQYPQLRGPGFTQNGTPSYPPSIEPQFSSLPHGNSAPGTHQLPQSNSPTPLVPAPGLPAKPVSNLPFAKREDLQQMHQGNYSPATQLPDSRKRKLDDADADDEQQPDVKAEQQLSITAADVNDLIEDALKSSDAPVSRETATPAAAAAAIAITPHEKKAKKDKDKEKGKERGTKLFYADNETSPEEKMAKWSRYAFNPMQEPSETVLSMPNDASGAGVTGPVQDEDDVVDAQGN